VCSSDLNPKTPECLTQIKSISQSFPFPFFAPLLTLEIDLLWIEVADDCSEHLLIPTLMKLGLCDLISLWWFKAKNLITEALLLSLNWGLLGTKSFSSSPSSPPFAFFGSASVFDIFI